MPDELKPCPNIHCPDPKNLNVGHAGGCWWVSCFCGVRSPAISKEKTAISTRDDAIAAWNALPRASHCPGCDASICSRCWRRNCPIPDNERVSCANWTPNVKGRGWCEGFLEDGNADR